MNTKVQQVAEYKLHDNDNGSTPVQIALLTKRINMLTEHFKINTKDNHSRLGLMKIIKLRQKLLKYYKRTQREAYYNLITALKIRDKN